MYTGESILQPLYAKNDDKSATSLDNYYICQLV